LNVDTDLEMGDLQCLNIHHLEMLEPLQLESCYRYCLYKSR